MDLSLWSRPLSVDEQPNLARDPRSFQDVPTLEPFDHRVREVSGCTFALDLQLDRIQAQKTWPRPNCEQRLVELVRENSSYKREICFFRTIYHAMEQARHAVSATIQQLNLNYYMMPGPDGRGEGEWLHLAEELEKALQNYAAAVDIAAEEWVDLESQQSRRDREDAM